jgi:hypothetical protein
MPGKTMAQTGKTAVGGSTAASSTGGTRSTGATAAAGTTASVSPSAKGTATATAAKPATKVIQATKGTLTTSVIPIASIISNTGNISAGRGSINTVDNDKDGIDDIYENELLREFRPYFLFSKDKVEGNLTAEHYNPADVVWYLKLSELLNTGDEDANPVMDNEYISGDPTRILGVQSTFGPANIRINPIRTNYHINPLNKVHGSSGDPGRHGNRWDEILQKRNVGLYGHVVRADIDYQRGVIQRSDNTYKYIKIEYWQFFGYNNANKVWDLGDHEGDWATIQVLYDPELRKIIKVFHYAHGDEMMFDMRTASKPFMYPAEWWGQYEEFRGPNYNQSFTNAGPTAQNNTVRFYEDPETKLFTHPIVYIEYGTHEFWPTEHGEYDGIWETKVGDINLGKLGQKAPPHRGDDASHRYLTETPPNLGEVEFPEMITDPAARIILLYNGYYGAYGKQNDPPQGPPLHTEWTWPANSALRPMLQSYIGN